MFIFPHSIIPDSDPVPIDPTIQQLGFLVGGTWEGDTELKGVATHIEESCSWVLDEQFIASDVTYAQGGKTILEARGLLGYDPVAKKLAQWSFLSVGAFVSGEQNPAKQVTERPSWSYIITAVSSAGSVEILTRLTKLGDDEIQIEQWPASDPHGPPANSITYTRTAAKT